MKTIDLNADLGEGSPHDAALIPLITSVNIACGGHAGTPATIRHTIELALQAQVAIGAHPSYEDPENFGRKPIPHTPQEIRTLTLRQLERILHIHPHLHHIKPHGALYHQANQNPTIATALIAAIVEILPHTLLYCPPHGALATAAAHTTLTTCPEGFIDRTYQDNGTLTPRSHPRAIITNATQAALQALLITQQKTVHTLNGKTIPLPARTLCLHGDSPHTLTTLKLTRSTLENAGIQITAP